MAWMAAREFWTGGKWVRVTDDLNATRWVGINQPVTVRDKLAEMDDQQRAMVMQQMQLVPGDPRLQQVVGIDNNISDLDVDITVQEGVDIPSIQAETFQTLVQLAGMQPGLIPGDVLIAASGLKDKDMLLERMKEHQQQQAGVQQKAAALAEQHAQADIAGKQAKAAADQALAQERKVNSVRGIHDVHAEFAAPPYGQPFQAPPDAPSAPGTSGAPPIPARASGGLVTRTLPAETWMGRLPDHLPGQLLDRGCRSLTHRSLPLIPGWCSQEATHYRRRAGFHHLNHTRPVAHCRHDRRRSTRP
jgi:hypothetical protein